MATSCAGCHVHCQACVFVVSKIAGLAVSAERSVSPARPAVPSANPSDGGRAVGWDDEEDRGADADFKPLTPEEAHRWRARYPVPSVWRVVAWQAGLMLVVSALAAVVVALTGADGSVVASVAYGGFSALLPSAVMAYGMTSSALARWLRVAFPGMARASLAGWLWWEGVKVLLVLAMLWTAPRWIPDLNWLGLVVGLVVVLKSYWLAWIARPTARN